MPGASYPQRVPTDARRSATWTFAWCALVFVSLRPVAPLERALGWALAPLRVLAEASAPVRLLRSGAVRAANDALAEQLEAEEAARARLMDGLVRAALPPPELAEGRRLVPGAVVGRARGNLDRLLVHVPVGEDLRPGMPVVAGDVYVGRVARRVPGRDDRVEVDLVTGAGVFVGAALPGEPGRTPDVLMAVGGIDPGDRRRNARLRLAVHNPSETLSAGPSDEGSAGSSPEFEAADELLPVGTLRVREVLASAAELGEEVRLGALADGYRLGALLLDHGRPVVAPALDYRAGLFQVTLLAPPRGDQPVPPLPEALTDEGWRRVRALSQGDPTPWRDGLVIAAGWREGVAPGAALVSGLRLLGRVDRAGPLSAAVRLLADPGLALVAVAAVEGEDEPRTLGRLVSAGRLPGGAVAFEWSAEVPLVAGGDSEENARDSSGAGGAESVRATLYTGAGEVGLPRGLLIGEAELPLGGARTSHGCSWPRWRPSSTPPRVRSSGRRSSVPSCPTSGSSRSSPSPRAHRASARRRRHSPSAAGARPSPSIPPLRSSRVICSRRPCCSRRAPCSTWSAPRCAS
jgi:hypothetical protein